LILTFFEPFYCKKLPQLCEKVLLPCNTSLHFARGFCSLAIGCRSLQGAFAALQLAVAVCRGLLQLCNPLLQIAAGSCKLAGAYRRVAADFGGERGIFCGIID
jgi:hypothetical protein